METVHDHHAARRQPAGLRRLTPAMVAASALAEQYAPAADTTSHYRYLAALKDAAPHAGIAARLVTAIDWFFHFSQAQDWQGGSRPIVWPSAQAEADHLGLTLSQVKRLNRTLIEHGLMIPVDSPTGKRYGLRDKSGRIIEAYGFDLSPLAVRFTEFLTIAAEARERRDRFNAYRRRITIARKGLRSLLATAAELDAPGDWTAVAALATGPAPRWGTPATADINAMAQRAHSLETAVAEANAQLSAVISPVEMHPAGRTDAPLQYNYNPNPNPKKDTVAALSESSSEEGGLVHAPAGGQPPAAQVGTDQPRTDRGACSTITPDELIRLAPRLQRYVMTRDPRWPDLVEAGDWLRTELGISKPLWADACLILGRERATIAVAILSVKPAEHFRSGPGGYFHGMLAKARAGELRLDRTIWALRRQAATGSPPRPALPTGGPGVKYH